MTSLRTVVDRVGPTLLHARYLPDTSPPAADVVIADPLGAAKSGAGDLVLGVACTSATEAVELIRDCSRQEAAAVLCKPPLPGTKAVQRAARSARVGLVEVRQAASWAQLVWLLRGVLDEIADESETPDTTTDAGAGELFRLADVAASVVDAPVTIEDTNSRVLAYSARQDLTDPARVSTIMGRRIPDDVLARFRPRGVFRELSRGRRTIFVPAQRDGTLPRLIVPVRMGGELLGSMWAVVPGPISDERAAVFADAAPVVALHLLRRRAHADSRRRASAESLRAVLAGGASARAAARALDLPDQPHRIVAIDTADTGAIRDTVDTVGLRLALLIRISEGIGRRPVAAELDGMLYVLVPDGPGSGGWLELRTALSEQDGQAMRAAAGAAHEVGELDRSRREADEAMGLLRAGLLDERVVSSDEVWTALVLHRAATASARITELGPIGRLRAHDQAQRTEYVSTLYEWLRHPGDPRAAATNLRIHPNTLRYRMRKLLEITPFDLDDPQVRLALTTQLITLYWS